jgi:hypothetical protein
VSVSQTVSLSLKMTPEAAARVTELGFQEAAEKLGAQARRLLPGLDSLQLILVPSYEMDEAPWLVFECYSEHAERDAREAIVAWYTWRAEKLPFEVGRYFMLSWVQHENAHAG